MNLIWFGQASLQPSTLSFFALRDSPGSVTMRQFPYSDFPASYGEDLAILVRLVATGRGKCSSSRSKTAFS